MAKKALIEQGGVFKKGRVMVTNILKNGPEGETKVYTVSGRVKITPMGDKYILDFTSVSGNSFGMTSRGTASGRVYRRQQSIAVEYYEIREV